MTATTLAFFIIVIAAGAAAADDHVSRDALAKAARITILADLDPNKEQCRPERSVEAWLRDLIGKDAKVYAWTGGRCHLVNEINPLDTGGRWCGQAWIRYTKPLDKNDEAIVEIYFERPHAGRPGKPAAFRGVMRAVGGWDYTRFSAHFELDWRGRFPHADPTCAPDRDADARE